ncbi:sulfite exporter TauE/SafE family protein [Haloarcula amylovorans]|uniref:sulfite exporter TauE/SafE family protein n=1 Tax=Haloarcula amylovorans TaxID=2562280 RepID=UPI001076558B|nr:sulfite exporter TauE/SafE family protein [Halomicroarcula amylolytica]
MTGTIVSIPLHGAGIAAAASTELIVFFVVGLLGGAHCLGMCGPLVTMYSKQLAAAPKHGADGMLSLYEVRQHALFNFGRTVSYAVLGGVFGLAGSLVFDAAGVVTVVGTVVRVSTGFVVGTVILVVGARYALGHHGSHDILGSGRFTRLFSVLTSKLEDRVTGHGIVGLGLVHGLLPCPLLYPAFLYAFAHGSPSMGVLALGTLGLGTFPTLFLYGTIVQSVNPTRRAYLHRALGVAFLFMGWMPLAHSLALLGVSVPHVEIPIYQPF